MSGMAPLFSAFEATDLQFFDVVYHHVSVLLQLSALSLALNTVPVLKSKSWVSWKALERFFVE